MSSEEVFEKVKAIIVDQLGVTDTAVTMEASFIDDLGADSLDIVELVMALEEEFDIEIPDTDAEKVVAVSDVVEYIKENIEFKGNRQIDRMWRSFFMEKDKENLLETLAYFENLRYDKKSKNSKRGKINVFKKFGNVWI